MNTQELIAEVDSIVDDSSFLSPDILGVLNQGQREVAAQILLPGLSDGHESVNSVPDGNFVSLPDTFHRELFLAQVDNVPVTIVGTPSEMATALGSFTTVAGSISMVAAHRGKLFYQAVPETVTAIELFFHRKTTPMEDIETSFPDALPGTPDEDINLEWALIHYACWRIFHKIEQDEKGPKKETGEHLGLFKEKISELSLMSHEEGVSYAPPGFNTVW